MNDIKKNDQQTQLTNFDLFYEELPLYSRIKSKSLSTRLIRRSKQQ